LTILRRIRDVTLLALLAAAAPTGLTSQVVVEPLAGVAPGDRWGCSPWLHPEDEVVARIRAAMSLADPDRALDTLRALEPGVRAAAAAAPRDARLQFRLVALLGARTNLVEGRAAVKVADELHDRTVALLEIEPRHAGAHHILGRLHAAAMRMGRLERFLARTLLGADLLASVSWEGARRHLERAERQDPCVDAHHWELARLYRERGHPALARREIEHLVELAAVGQVEREILARTRLLDEELSSVQDPGNRP
jgi:hypothetical protein